MRRFVVPLVVVATVLVMTFLPAAGRSTMAVPTNNSPNIILITTDDMNRSDLRWMPVTRALLADRGVTVSDFISNHPLCCPARAQILTGQYAQNNGVHDNDNPVFGGAQALQRPDENIGRWLRRAGYRTAFVGKYLNYWARTAIRPAGWTVFNPLQGLAYRPYGFTMYNNGDPTTYARVYTADLMGRLARSHVERFSRDDRPFFIWVSQVPPHKMRFRGEKGLPVPAPRHREIYSNARPPSLGDPSFNEADLSDKPAWLADREPVDRRAVVELHRARVRSLASVDEQVGALVDTLRKERELSNTYIVFTSDNGVLLGEHRLTMKNWPYEPDLAIPLIVRGPGLPQGRVRDVTFGLVDLAPTFLDMANATAGRPLDGRSMLPSLRDGDRGYSQYLIQAGSTTAEWRWRGVRSSDHTYVRHSDGTEELYDRVNDPSQLQNLAGEPGSARLLKEYGAWLEALQDCAGAACHGP